MEEGRIIACQLSYIPVQSPDINKELGQVLEIIKVHFPNCEIGEFSTIVKGTARKVLQLINSLIEKMDQKGSKFNIQISLSNICGCEIN